jgi:hypothetical protein
VLAEREARFADVLAAAEAGIARASATRTTRVATGDTLLPALIASRALGFAALGRVAEAHAVGAELAKVHPGFHGLEVSLLRVRAIASTRAGDLASAREHLRARPKDLAIPYTDEVLADALEVALGSPDEVERERVRSLVRRDARIKTWLEVVAPGLSEIVGRASSPVEQHIDEAPRAAEDLDVEEPATVEPASAVAGERR